MHVAIYVKPYLYLVANVSFKPSFSNGESFSNCKIPIFCDIYDELLVNLSQKDARDNHFRSTINTHKRTYLSLAADIPFSKFFETIKQNIGFNVVPILISTLDMSNNEIPIDLFILEVFQHQYL